MINNETTLAELQELLADEHVNYLRVERKGYERRWRVLIAGRKERDGVSVSFDLTGSASTLVEALAGVLARVPS
jgi:hypothetical protein